MSKEFDVSAVCFYRQSAHPDAATRQRAIEALREFARVVAFPIPQECSSGRLVWDHLRSVVTGTAYTRWAHESSEARTAIRDLASRNTFDLVHVDSLDLMAYLPNLPAAPIVLAHHNVESSLLRRRANVERGLMKTYVRHQAKLVEQAEREWCRRVDLNVAVSDADAQQLREFANGTDVLVTPNGVDTKSLLPSPGEPKGGLLFVGGYSWFPNADAMGYFADEILPLIRRARPETTVRWIGRDTTEARQRFAEHGIEMLGYVADIRPFVEEATCVVVPLRIGGGTRLKILDAWSLGKAVVSTSVGCEGLEARSGTNIMVEDTPQGFADVTLRILGDGDLRRALEQGGRDTAVRLYDWDSLGERMLRRYCALLTKTA
ncbi:MAG: glycosyltransferase family 4 protein [Longimicrobiales bacterium]